MFVLNRQDHSSLYTQLYEQIRSSILSGEMEPGLKLPSIRSVSADLRISKTTVETAYSKLYLEGFLTTKPKSGYYVSTSNILFAPAIPKNTDNEMFVNEDLFTDHDLDEEPPRYDFYFKNRIPDDHLLADWQKLLNRCMREYKREMSSYRWNMGELGLRQEILKYLRSYRNIHCSLDQIIITSGTCSCYDLISRLLTTKNYRIALESPGILRSHLNFERHGLQISPVGLDSGGINMQELRSTSARAVMVNPSPHFPTGIIMPLSRRLELIEWAKETKSFIIEHDWDYYTKYHANPIPALQSFAPERVIYIHTFSKILFPSVRIAFMVVPQNLVYQCKHDCVVPFIMQKSLELFMKEGYWDKHLRKTLREQRQKYNALLDSFKEEFGDCISISGHPNSYLMISPQWPVTENNLVSKAFKAGVRVNPVSAFASSDPDNPKSNGAVLLSYGGINLDDIPTGVKLLRQAWLED